MPSRFDIEDTVRHLLAQDFGVLLSKMRLPIGIKANGEKKFHEFDCVSADRQIVAEIKTNELKATPDKPFGRYFGAIKWALLGDLYVLARIQAQRKYLVLTDEPLFEMCQKDMDGLLPENTQLKLQKME